MVYGQDYFTPGFVNTLAHGLLVSAAGSLSSPPSAQWVAHGKPAADGCDQLVVWVENFRLVRVKGPNHLGGSGGISETRGPLDASGALPAVDMKVQLLRCGAPMVQGDLLPTPAAMDAHGVAMLTDGWALYRGLLAAWHSDTLLGSPDPVPAHQTSIGTATAYGPEGGVSGWMVPVVVTLG